MAEESDYPQETAGSLMITNIPTARPKDTAGSILKNLAHGDWDDIHAVYVTHEDKQLVGLISIYKILKADKDTQIENLIEEVKVKVLPTADQEKVVIGAVRNDVKSVAVVDDQNHLLGAITADQIIDILHEEHLEDFLRSSGIRGKGSRILQLMTASFYHIIWARLPWLIVGLGVGLAASFVVSRFEHFLSQNVALAFFISMIAYMSDAVGTQSETIFIRAITFTKFGIINYLVREFLIGLLMGSTLGLFAGIAAYIISGSSDIGFTVGLALLVSMSISTVLACLVPLTLRALGKDPAIGSGPFTTSVQDLLSITIYFTIAMLILGNK